MMEETYSSALARFETGIETAGKWMELAAALPQGSPGQKATEKDAMDKLEEMSILNREYGFVDADIVVLAVRSILQKTVKGSVANTADNILRIFRYDPKYRYIRYNLVTDSAEIQGADRDGEPVIKKWTDADEADSRCYVEKHYGISSRDKHGDALRLLFRAREYNPIIDLIEPVKWDGENRCEMFLTKWGKCEDSAYTREVSRLIFAGGIWRLYQPGCKFDDVPILIGTKQGEGKSSLIRFLAINDSYYGECNLFDGNQAIEQLAGKWIVEIGELLALTRTKDVEASKAYITRAFDHYRKPWDKNPVDLPRRCIFLGTTNNATPLRDVYNRRFYPIRMNTVGYDLFDQEAEIREYILQCWAEARDRYRAKKMPNYARRDLVDEYRAQQDAARQDDWREGAIETYLADKSPGDYVCIRELTNKALAKDGLGHDPSVVESKDLGMIMGRFDDWERTGPHNFSEYGKQRAWRKRDMGFREDNTLALPF